MSQIIPRNQWQAKLNEVFYNDAKHTNSRDSLFRAVRDFGITRSYVDKFIRAQPAYQTHYPSQPKHNVPTIRQTKPGYLQMDFMSIDQLKSPLANNLLNFVDVFSRKVWSFPTKTRESKEVIECIAAIIDEYPFLNTIQSDNGPEFAAESVVNFLEKYGIHQVFSSIATPTANAFVERFNGRIKKALYAYKAKTGKDPIKELDSFVEQFNLTPNTTTKVIPELALLPDNFEKINENVEKYNAKKSVGKKSQSELQIGDLVRVSLEKSVKNSAMANTIIKQKGYMPKWSFDVYKIKKILKPQLEKSFTTTYYTVDGGKDWEWLDNRKFQRHDLLKVSEETDQNRYIPKHQLYDFATELYEEKKGLGRRAKQKVDLPVGTVGRPPKKKKNQESSIVQAESDS